MHTAIQLIVSHNSAFINIHVILILTNTFKVVFEVSEKSKNIVSKYQRHMKNGIISAFCKITFFQ